MSDDHDTVQTMMNSCQDYVFGVLRDPSTEDAGLYEVVAAACAWALNISEEMRGCPTATKEERQHIARLSCIAAGKVVASWAGEAPDVVLLPANAPTN
jgi:hypothetical protein